MAARRLTATRANAILAALLIILIAALPSSARATILGLTYHLTVCGESGGPQPGSPCYVETPQSPLPASLAEIDTAVQDYYTRIPHQYHIDFTITGANNAGVVYGHAFDYDEVIDTQFIFYRGTVFCCTRDFPFEIAGINDHGMEVGNDSLGPFASSVLGEYSPSMDWPPVNLDSASINYLASQYNQFWQLFFFEDTQFAAIDDANRISGANRVLGSFVLTPIPEPGSALTLLAALVLFPLLRQRANRAV